MAMLVAVAAVTAVTATRVSTIAAWKTPTALGDSGTATVTAETTTSNMATAGDSRAPKATIVDHITTPVVNQSTSDKAIAPASCDGWLRIASPSTALLMIENKIGGLPVVDQDLNVLGIITESDLFEVLVQQLDRQAEQP